MRHHTSRKMGDTSNCHGREDIMKDFHHSHSKTHFGKSHIDQWIKEHGTHLGGQSTHGHKSLALTNDSLGWSLRYVGGSARMAWERQD